ncbi:MAG: sulfurtransferase complex subunit TusB [Pseudomonadales bacterium]|nr:sulfurtransferase complex subunit TusB [Pseudomonadales bacterium]
MILHTVNQSPQQSTTLISCLRVAADGSAILLIEDGVYGALDNAQTKKIWQDHTSCDTDDTDYTDYKLKQASVKCYVLKEDLEARGLLNRVSQAFTIVDYQGFVELATEHHVVQSWF